MESEVAIPADMPVAGYSVTVTCTGSGTTSAPRLINVAEPWWFQGDIGNATTAGGWLRIQGPVIRLESPSSVVQSLESAIREVRDAMTAPGMAADMAWTDESPLTAFAARLLDLRAQLAAARAAGTVNVTARLTPIAGGKPTYLTAEPTNVSIHSAYFAIPADIPLGDYVVDVSNGFGPDSDPLAPSGVGSFASASFFESAFRPDAATISIQAPKAWPAGVFVVAPRAIPACCPAPPVMMLWRLRWGQHRQQVGIAVVVSHGGSAGHAVAADLKVCLI